ncbi:hypothetical protein OnM2_099001 [Erysiphe neolycopersici]|uniref:Uncharacterized protein n=1 Tax=Erysiphe neolycopersici TaxID=212602 RepID=A0A420HA36_9PEZI|nr:hypothetical protein OnM2_099001 [Erysiphe neolycopersici]
MRNLEFTSGCTWIDPGPHFGERTRKFAESNGVKAVDIKEKSVDILQQVIKKMVYKMSKMA